MPERVQQPADLHVHAEVLAAITLRIKHLADEGLPARHVVVGHDVQAAHNLQPALRHKSPERARLFRIPFEKRPEVGYLVERESVVRMFLEQADGSEDVRQSHLQMLLARLEPRALPMRMRNEPESWF